LIRFGQAIAHQHQGTQLHGLAIKYEPRAGIVVAGGVDQQHLLIGADAHELDQRQIGNRATQ
jgi:hypothetical protein